MVCQSHIIELPKITDPRGNLTFIEGLNHIPFKIQRVFWIYDVPGGEIRGGHAYKTTQEFIVAISGSFDVILNDGKKENVFSLNRSYYGLYVPAGTWRQMRNFSTNSLALVLASTYFDESDYIRDYEDFVNYSKKFSLLDDESLIDINNNLIDLNNQHNEFSDNRFVKSFFSTQTEDCLIIEMPKIYFRAGNITPINNNYEVTPFVFNRLFYIYDIPGGESRGAHSHKQCHQFIIAASGSFSVEINDGKNKKTLYLNNPYRGLYVPPGIWASEKKFSSGSICLVLASDIYDENDYIRNYKKFKNYKNEI